MKVPLLPQIGPRTGRQFDLIGVRITFRAYFGQKLMKVPLLPKIGSRTGRQFDLIGVRITFRAYFGQKLMKVPLLPEIGPYTGQKLIKVPPPPGKVPRGPGGFIYCLIL